MHSAYGSRLLSIGEIFDRAVHVTVANLLPLVMIVGLVSVPTRAIADWLSKDAINHTFGAEGKVVADPRLLPYFFTLARDPQSHGFNWPALIWFLVALLPLSLSIGAASIAARGILAGEASKLGTAYTAAFRRLAPIFGASILAWAVYFAAIIAIVIIGVVFLAVWGLTIARGGSIGASSAMAVVVVAFAAIGAAIVWLAPLANCTSVGAALYPLRPFRALREARMMTMSRGHRARSFAFGVALLAFVVAQQLITWTVCGFLSNVSHSAWLSFVASDTMALLALTFEVSLGVVFYLDARNRIAELQDPLSEQQNSRNQ